ncbi:hypothetical protein LEP1GSC185_1013 [Leptospira licerasiae serovar Varillal str. VAR 010]|uniref:Lipoprotein n=1 Tax=Leptospira licerasiae str. MMD4847 TaxID=1049971 RepID=A0ABN0HAF0_9LEPT|nr:hypothetical protein LEP1GSC185_1013 [Leptospira licerasiae serovar Varillal str. VAR 010]EJZ42593.1 putative lipoprotein [Leptospira licerasiae str. MMD4847]
MPKSFGGFFIQKTTSFFVLPLLLSCIHRIGPRQKSKIKF